MAQAEKISCQKRDIKSKGYLNELKRSGLVPGTVYGKGIENQAVSLVSKQLSRIFQVHGSRGLFSLEIDGDSGLMVVVREVQRHPITGQITHVDFWKVRLDEKINSTVGISIVGEEEIMKKGGILQAGAKEIEVSCLPQDIPETLVYDIAALEIGDKVTVADLQVPADVEILSDLDTLVATVLAPTVTTEDEEVEGEGEAEGVEAEETEATEGE
jgi:large subunit ribosomal protein L25